MFKVDKLPLTVRFKRIHLIHPRFNESRLCYDCKIFTSNIFTSSDDILITCGMSCLNPKDSNNHILGKKIALQKALSWNFNKKQRTQIWKAFFEWACVINKGE